VSFNRRASAFDLARRLFTRVIGSSPIPTGQSVALSGDEAVGIVLMSGDSFGSSEGLSGDFGGALYPESIALWLDLESPDTSTISGAVAVLGDRSGNGYNLTQVDGTKRPTYTASDADFGGRPSMTFDGVDDFLRVANLPAWEQHTVCIVMHGGGGPGLYLRMFDYTNVGATATTELQMQGATNSIVAEFLNTPGTTYKAFAVTAGVTRRVSAAFDTSVGATAIPRIYLDGVDTGVSYSLTTAGNGPATGPMYCTLGANVLGGGPFNGKLAEVIVYDRVLSGAEIIAVDAWLAARFP